MHSVMETVSDSFAAGDADFDEIQLMMALMTVMMMMMRCSTNQMQHVDMAVVMAGAVVDDVFAVAAIGVVAAHLTSDRMQMLLLLVRGERRMSWHRM